MSYIAKTTLLVIILLSLYGCLPFPARIIMPLETQVIDADSGAPIEGAYVLRIVCDIHDIDCSHATMERALSDENGYIEMDGKRKWGLYSPAPGGWPVPNHQIAIWKPGYKAFVFSQYGFIENIEHSTKRQDIKDAILEIPADRDLYSPDDKPEEMFQGGKVKLHRRKD